MLFSVIVPMYNVKPYAEKCIASILKQNFNDYELILVDDGSKDGTEIIIDDYAKQNERIHVIHKRNEGLTSARKAGAAVAKGEYIVAVDGDDWIEPEYLRTFERAITRFHPDLVISGYTENRENDCKNVEAAPPFIRPGFYHDNEIKKTILPNLFSIIPTIWAKAIKREIYVPAQYKVDDIISIGEDGCIVYPIVSNATSLCLIEGFLYHYRINSGSMTNRRNRHLTWSNVIWRINHYEGNLPLNEYGMIYQLSHYIIHMCFYASLSNFDDMPYKLACKSIKGKLESEPISKYVTKFQIYGTKKERIVGFLLQHKFFSILKLYHILFK